MGSLGWLLLTGLLAGLVLVPVLFVVSSVWSDTHQIWQHLVDTVLGRYIRNSLLLMLGVGIGSLVIGVTTAWLVSMCQFPMRGWMEWGLLLPLAAPAYVLAYVYTDFLQFTGPLQTQLRQWLGWSVHDYWFPNIRSLPGAMALLTLVLYPYVYLVARVAFLEQSTCILEVSRSLGQGPWRSFWRVALPLARPSVVAGLALALMETLNDFGTVQYFGVETFTTGIYRTWFGFGERVAAAQLAAFLLLFVLILLLIEQVFRQRARYHQVGGQHPLPRYPLKGLRAWAAGLACGIPILLGFLLPAGLLLRLALENPSQTLNARTWLYGSHSLLLAGISACLAVVLALLMAYGVRLYPVVSLQLTVRLAAMGYALPGSVIAVGVLIPLGRLDNWVDGWMRQYLGVSTGLLLSGTITALIFAYLVRFLAVAFHTVEAGLTKIKPHLDEAARSLGGDAGQILRRIHAPLLGGSLLTSALLVFVDVMKELPATMVIRPFNFDTLAVRAYQLAADERLTEAAGPALAIVAVGLLPVIILSWQITRTAR
ncbi:MAG: iron ABC transporter permease [Cyanobacteriota bacterium]|nr:iron ABC transporter permease [Cyanobacteriota bacterium]